MKIIIGSANPQKIKAVQEMAPIYEFMQNAEVLGIEVDSGISDQPKTLDEIILGAKNRAQNAFNSTADATLGFGIESGINPTPHTKTGFVNLCACAIYDGNDFYIGLSGAFELPSEVIDLIVNEGMNTSDACKKIGLTSHEYVGHADGIIGILSKSKLTRLTYSKQAVQMALVRYENKELY